MDEKKENDDMTVVQEAAVQVEVEVPMMTLADIRRLAGKSQSQVAEKMGVTKGRVGQIEKQYPSVTFPVLRAYMEAAGVRVQFAVPGGGVVQAAAVGEDDRVESREARRNRTRGDAGRFV